jgi:hypothetical protein
VTPERRERILQIAQELEQEGLEATNSAVYSRALGHRGDVVQVMKARRAERNGGVALLEEEPEPPAPTAQELQEDLAQLTASYDAWHLALERLWEIEQEGPLSEQNFARKQWLEYQLAANLTQQEQLQRDLARARLVDAVETARQRHDSGMLRARVLAEAVIQALAHLGQLLAQLEEHFVAQLDDLSLIRAHDGRQQFPLPSGREELVNLVGRVFPGDYRAAAMVQMLLDSPPTEGRHAHAMAECARLSPFPEHLIERYLAELEGGTHASDT